VLELLRNLVDLAAGTGVYAEARHEERLAEDLLVRNGAVEQAESDTSEGLGVRVRVGGAWGFAATSDVSKAGAEEAFSRALALARALPAVRPTPLAPAPPATGHWATAYEIDPFTVSTDDKLALLHAAEAAIGTDERLVSREARFVGARTRKALATSEGTAVTQEFVESGAAIVATAVGNGEVQTRSYPLSHSGDVAGRGWEHVLGLDLAAHGPRVGEEALALLTAPVCPEGRRTIILHGEQVALQVHESIGHALELDRMLLGEASYAGTSWVTAADLDPAGAGLVYGSTLLNVTADATLPAGLGSFGWDDEGVAGRRYALIEGGRLRAALSNRESAAAIGLDASGGCARADGFARQPIVRMTNVSLEPGDAGTLDDLIADTDDGLYLETNRSWSIDDRRLHFQFGTEVAYEIRGGERGRLLRNPSYAGITPQFWGSLDAVCSRSDWHPWGLANCGKGEPGQLMRVSHGAAPARFRDVQVGVA
jgi:TldD protein